MAVQVQTHSGNIMPKKTEHRNVLELIFDLLADQKRNSKVHGKMLILAVVDGLNNQYQKYLDSWAEKAEELKEARAMEFDSLKKSLNSTGGWFIGGMILGGMIIGGILGGPAGAIVGALIAGAIAGGGVLGDHLSADNDKFFFDSNKEIDVLKSKARDTVIEQKTMEAKHIQDKANVKQGEISRTMQIEMESNTQLETAVSNMIVKLVEIITKISNIMR